MLENWLAQGSADELLASNALLIVALVRVMRDAQQSFIRSRENRSSSRLALVAAVQRATPAHGVLTQRVAQKEKSVNAQIISALSLVVLGRVNFSINLLIEVRFNVKLFCWERKKKFALVSGSD